MSTESEYPDYVCCPLVDHYIEAGDCMDNRDVVAGNIKSSLSHAVLCCIKLDTATENNIIRIVYELFGFTKEEVTIIQALTKKERL